MNLVVFNVIYFLNAYAEDFNKVYYALASSAFGPSYYCEAVLPHPTLPPKWFFLGSPMLMDPQLGLQHAGLKIT